MEYKGYTARMEYDEEDRIFHGRVLDINDVVSFEGTTVETLEADFHAAIDDYLAFCKEQGLTPEKPFSGKLNLRMAPTLRRRVHNRAQQQGTSINSFIVSAVEKELSQH